MEDMENVVAVAELAEELKHSVSVSYVSPYFAANCTVEAGETYRWGELTDGRWLDEEEQSRGGLVILNSAQWGDYDNSATWHRANYVALQNDYEETFIHVGLSSHDGLALALPLSASIPESLADILRGLEDYPVYDEGVLSEIEMKIEDEAWDSWVQWDLTREIEKAYEVQTGQEWDTFEPVWAEAEQWTLFHAAREELNVYAEFESADSCHYRELPEMAAWILARLQSAVMV